ncbi:hypothetical protein D9613_010699 [Agrocybe pediades]|uniref:Uncharacterized protein n=1 Tax=Agrocybe pediades TaxID=84607 RepID=A0A8H4QLZ1_9AGAR|nr:hypothetical protein D9613_010699 [Agrocybe pediades]
MHEHVDGCSHIFIGCGVFFKAEISPTDLMQAAKEAWIRTRFAAPWVAQRTSSASSELAEPNSWMNTYETSSVPKKGFERAVSWAESTLFWRDEVRSLEEWEEVLKNAYWRPSDGRFGMEWHFARGVSENEYFIMYAVPHYLTSAARTKPISHLTLRLEIRGGQTPTRDLPWGSEVSNLPPATVVAIEHKKENVDLTMPQPPTHKEFLRPLIETPQWERLPDRQADIKLSRQETLALHAICKGKKVTITALINSLCILADVQTAFHAAPDNASLERVLEDFKAAERSMLPESITLSRGPVGFGNLVMQVQPTVHNMDHIRNIVQVEEYDEVSSKLGNAAFWGGLVAQSGLSMKENKSCTPEKFVENEHLLDAIMPVFHKDLFFTPGLGSTSIGKLSSLNLFNEFRPSIAASNPLSPFVMSSLALGLRITGPDTMHVMVMMWEYDGELVVHLLASPRWHGEKVWKFYVDMIKNSLESVLQGPTKL